MNTFKQNLYFKMIEVIAIANGSFQFCIKNENNKILVTSVAVSSIEKIEMIIKELKNSGAKNLKFERTTNHKGEFLFNVKGKDRQLIGSSELYNSEAGMENGIGNLKIRLATLRDF